MKIKISCDGKVTGQILSNGCLKNNEEQLNDSREQRASLSSFAQRFFV